MEYIDVFGKKQKKPIDYGKILCNSVGVCLPRYDV